MKEVFVNIMDVVVGVAVVGSLLVAFTSEPLPQAILTALVVIAAASTWYVLSAILDKLEGVRIEIERSNRLAERQVRTKV